MMKLVELLRPWVSKAIPACEILSLANDSRKVKAGSLFFAYPGAFADGRLFIKEACQAGAAAVLYEPEALPLASDLPTDIPCIPFPQLGKKLALIASRFYDEPSRFLSITGVTGTNGKTTIAYQLAQAYELLNHKATYIGTIGYGRVDALKALANTTPDALCLQQLLYDYQQDGVQNVCMEVSSHALAQGRVDQIDFTQAIFTNLSHEHLDYHHTLEAYAEAKSKLFELPSLKFAILNHDDSFYDFMCKKIQKNCQKLSYGLKEGSDLQARHCQINMRGSQFDLISPWGEHSIQVNLLGLFNIYNSLAVLASLLAAGIAMDELLPLMKRLRASPGRMEVVSEKPCVIVDYAHTPDALENVLSSLMKLKEGKLLVVFGCGGDRDKTKRPKMGHIASLYADAVILTSDNPRSEDPLQVMNDIAEGLLPTVKVLKIVDREEAICQALKMVEEDDILLIAGKGHEDYQIIGKERFAFSDQDVVRRMLNRS